MKRLTAVATLWAVFLLTPFAAVRAQLPGIPVYNTPIPSGLAVGADVGFPNGTSGLGTSYAITGALGTGPFGFTASIGGTKIEATNATRVTVGGTANWKVFGGPLIPLAVNVQAGAAFWQTGGSSNISFVRVPVGVSATLTIPTPGMAIKPWIAPRLDYVRGSQGGASSDATEFGFSIGLDLAFLNGLGVRAAFDWVDSATTVGVGLNYAFKIPGR
jgi:hypothetical protein